MAGGLAVRDCAGGEGLPRGQRVERQGHRRRPAASRSAAVHLRPVEPDHPRRQVLRWCGRVRPGPDLGRAGASARRHPATEAGLVEPARRTRGRPTTAGGSAASPEGSEFADRGQVLHCHGVPGRRRSPRVRRRQLLTIGHSYVVALNRRLAHEMARTGAGTWEVTAVAPKFVHGDLRPITLEPAADEACRVEPVRVYLSRKSHVMAYGKRVRDLVRGDWDLVHCWEEPYVLAGFQVARWTPARTPFVFWTAQNLSKRYPPPFGRFERYCLRRAAGLLACGQTTVEAQLARGYGVKPHRVMPLGVDLDVFRPDAAAGAAVRRQLGWAAEGPPVVGFLGRFVVEKGVRFLTRVLDEVKTPWRALFVGGGPLEPELHA